MTRTAWIVSASLSALLVVVAILLVIIIGQNNAAAEAADHARIVEICRDQTANDSDPYALADCIIQLKGD
jgi:hypothetical protein